MANIKTRWLASLSDGSIAVEGKTPYEEIDNEPSPWQKLLLHLAKNKLTITGLRIQLEKDGEATKTYNLPSVSKNQKWANLKPDTPKFFSYFRRVDRDMKGYTESGKATITGEGDEKHFIEIHAYYEAYELILIVDEDEGNECWTLVVPKGGQNG